MRPIWTGGISFGLIFIPVRVFSASKERELEFHMVDKRTMDRIGYKKINKRTGKEVTKDDIAKAYQNKKDELVVIEDEEFEAAMPDKSKTIDIFGFAKLEEIDPKYFEKPYYLQPEEDTAKIYHLLAEAISKTGKVGIARFVLHQREHLAAIIERDGALLLLQLRYADEVAELDELELDLGKKGKISEEELELATDFIDKLTKPFDPEKYEDNYIEELKKIIRLKAANEQIHAQPASKQPTKVTDIMAQLQKSLQSVKA